MLMLKKPWEKMQSGGWEVPRWGGRFPPHSLFLGADALPRPPGSFQVRNFPLSPYLVAIRLAPAATTGARRSEALICSVLCAKQSRGREPQHETAPTTTRPGVRPLKL